MSTAAYAAVIVLILLIIAVLAYRRAKHSDTFMPGDGATPKLREAVTTIGKDLDCISQAADAIEIRKLSIDNEYGKVDMGPAFNEARLSLSGSRQGMQEIVETSRRLRARVGTMTPTYQNVLGLYRGLESSDESLWKAAQALDTAGKNMQDLVSSTDDHQVTGQLHVHVLKQELSAAATTLRHMSTCLYGLVRSVHYLGSALQLE